MTLRLTCDQCRASFLVTDEQLGRLVPCPKCHAPTRVPSTAAESARLAAAEPDEVPRPSEAPAVPLAVADDEPEDSGRRRADRRARLVPFVLGLIASLSVATLILWPMLRRPDSGPDVAVSQAPIDPVERTSRAFLDAIVAGDDRAIDRLSTLTDPPAISSYGDVQRDPAGDETVRGSFAPIAALHRRIASAYTYDPAIDRFRNANPLGVAADFMDEAERLRRQNESGDLFGRIAGGTADEQLDAAVQFAEQFARLTRVALPRTELVPTYAQLVADADPPLPPEAERLARDFGEDKRTWDALLGRPFFTIEADGPFVLDRAEVVATIRDRLASAGDPPRRLRIELVRFRLDAIDTGWKVVAARREDPPPPPRSPGEDLSFGLEGSGR